MCLSVVGEVDFLHAVGHGFKHHFHHGLDGGDGVIEYPVFRHADGAVTVQTDTEKQQRA